MKYVLLILLVCDATFIGYVFSKKYRTRANFFQALLYLCQKFDIEITNVNRQKEADSKGLEIEVTDERLLSHCGGIVQGMSGSPIVQNDKIVGAVTHVFLSDSSKGYGVYSDWMLEQLD